MPCIELWCWRRLLRVPWTARRSNQSVLKEISPEYSLEGLMLRLKPSRALSASSCSFYSYHSWCIDSLFTLHGFYFYRAFFSASCPLLSSVFASLHVSDSQKEESLSITDQSSWAELRDTDCCLTYRGLPWQSQPSLVQGC